MKANYTVEAWHNLVEVWYVVNCNLPLDVALRRARDTKRWGTTRIVRQLYGRPVVWHSEEDY